MKNNEITFTHAQLEILYGTMMGDGYLTQTKCNSILAIEHSTKQQVYCTWKAEALGLTTLVRDRFDARTGKTYHSIIAYSKASTTYTELRNRLYHGHGKTLDEAVLNELGPLGLAVWYMDDGSTHFKKRTCILCTEKYSLKENQIIQQWFINKWGLHPIISEKACNGNMKYVLIFNCIDSYKLLDIIKPFMTPDLAYKLIVSPYIRTPKWYLELNKEEIQ